MTVLFVSMKYCNYMYYYALCFYKARAMTNTIFLFYLWVSHKSVAMRRRWIKPGKFEQNLETDLTIVHPSEALSGRLRLVADF